MMAGHVFIIHRRPDNKRQAELHVASIYFGTGPIRLIGTESTTTIRVIGT